MKDLLYAAFFAVRRANENVQITTKCVFEFPLDSLKRGRKMTCGRGEMEWVERTLSLVMSEHKIFCRFGCGRIWEFRKTPHVK